MQAFGLGQGWTKVDWGPECQCSDTDSISDVAVQVAPGGHAPSQVGLVELKLNWPSGHLLQVFCASPVTSPSEQFLTLTNTLA